MHPDSLPQDLKTHEIEESQHQKAFKALLPIVQGDYCFFESVLMDYFPDVYNNWSENELNLLHIDYHKHNFFSCTNEFPIYKKWLEMCEWETNRRIAG